MKAFLVNLIKQLNNFQFTRYGELLNGLLVRNNLALNRHWYDVLLDFSLTTLIIDLNDSVNLSKLKGRFDVYLL